MARPCTMRDDARALICSALPGADLVKDCSSAAPAETNARREARTALRAHDDSGQARRRTTAAADPDAAAA